MKKEEQKNEHGKHVLQLTISGKQYEWHHEYITGAEIRKLGNIPLEEEIFLAIKKPWEDEPIADDTKVNLADLRLSISSLKTSTIRLLLL